MRYLVWFIASLVFLVVMIFVAAFTPVGNSFVKPIIESRISKEMQIQSRLSTFALSTNSVEAVLEIEGGNSIKIQGRYSLFSQSFDLLYEVGFKHLESLESLAQMPLRGSFYTNGTLKGDLSLMKIEGKTDLAEGGTLYYAELQELKPTSIVAKMKNAKLASLLYLAGKNPYATAEIDLDINLKNITPHAMDGEVKLKSKNGSINPQFMKSDFNVTVPKTSFSLNLDAKLKGDDIDYRCDLSSNLFKINSSGRAALEPLHLDVVYALDIQNLEVLKPITNADIRGEFKLDGDAKGNKEALVLNAKSDLASSDTTIKVSLRDFVPMSLQAKIQDLKIEKLLYMLKQPHYSDGLLSVDAEIKDARLDTLDGVVKAKITKGEVDANYMTKAYSFKSPMPPTAYELSSTTQLSGGMANSNIELSSNLAKVSAKEMIYNIKEGSLKSDYSATIFDLQKLFFITNQKMQGSLSAKGEIIKAKDLDVTLFSNVADGVLEAKLHNNELRAEIKEVRAEKIASMLLYPKLLEANISAKLGYDLAQSKGEVISQIEGARFMQNQTFDLVKQFVKFDLYRELFRGNANAKIDKDSIVASLDLTSKEAAIKTEQAKINTKENLIDADVMLRIKKDELHAKLRGDMNSPKVTIDLEKFMKTQAGQEVQEKINKEVDKLFQKLLK